MQAISATFTGHGGRMDEAALLYPAAARPWIDLSTGLNPRPWRPETPLEIDAAPLPGRNTLRALEAAAARHFGVDPARVAAVPGSEIVLRLLTTLDLPRPISSLTPGYATHGEIADGTLPSSMLAHAPAGTLLIANPNNPDGALLAPDSLLSMIHTRGAAGGWSVVDEAFADAVPGSSIVPLLQPNGPVIVLRSFGKFFGLAGLRLGFVIASEKLLAHVRRLFGDWPVSAHAIALGTAAYDDQAWITATIADLPGRAARLDALLARHGLAASGACPLFRLVESPKADCLFDRLAHAGILVRPFDDHPTWLRFGLPGSDDAFDRLDHALKHG